MCIKCNDLPEYWAFRGDEIGVDRDEEKKSNARKIINWLNREYSPSIILIGRFPIEGYYGVMPQHLGSVGHLVPGRGIGLFRRDCFGPITTDELKVLKINDIFNVIFNGAKIDNRELFYGKVKSFRDFVKKIEGHDIQNKTKPISHSSYESDTGPYDLPF